MKLHLCKSLDIKIELENLFKEIGIDNYKNEIKILLTDIAGINELDLLNNKEIEAERIINLETAVNERINGRPLQYILGEWDFYGNTFLVGEGVLIPRPETELIIDYILNNYEADKNCKIIDLCTGSGCIAITLAKLLPNSCVTAVDYYDIPLEFCKKNIIKHNIKNISVLKTNVLKTVEILAEYDIIVSNPPYIDKKHMEAIAVEVQHEPQTALYGGDDGLDFYKAIISNYSNSLISGGIIVLEIGYNQAQAISGLLIDNFREIEIIKDYNGLDRIVVAKKE